LFAAFAAHLQAAHLPLLTGAGPPDATNSGVHEALKQQKVGQQTKAKEAYEPGAAHLMA
jgi:hypothetical protein